MTSSRKRAPTSPVRSAASACSASSRASTAARCSPCEPNRRRSRPPAGSATAPHEAPGAGIAPVAAVGTAAAERSLPSAAPSTSAPSAPTSTNRRSSRWGPSRVSPRCTSTGRRSRRRSSRASSSKSRPSSCDDQLQREALPGGREPRGELGEAAAEVGDEGRAPPAELDRGARELRVPRVERRGGRPGAHVDELGVALPQRRLHVARGGRVRRVDGGREGVDVSAPPRRTALHQEQALGHEDEHLTAAAEVVERGHLEPVPAHALALAGRVGDLDLLEPVAERRRGAR